MSHRTADDGPVSDADKLFAGYCRQARAIYWSLAGQFDARLTGREPTPGQPKHNPRWDGGEDDYGREHKPVWPKIVRTAVESDVTLVDLVAAQFNVATPTSRPTPAQCHGPKALFNVERAEVMMLNELQGSLAHHQECFLQTVGMRLPKTGATVEFINDVTYRAIVDPNAEIDPLFRYCEATRLGVRQLLPKDARLRAAVIYMKKRKAYDAVWGDFLPADLVQVAATLRAQILKIKEG